MMPSSITSLPLELEDMIIQHLSGDKAALLRCALVSRAWSVLSQRALFRNVQVNLNTHKKMTNFLDDLMSIPHLQTLVRGLTIHQRRPYYIPLPAHMSCLTSVLFLLPNLMKVEFKSEMGEDRLGETRSYLDLILGSARLVELDIAIYSVENFHHVFSILGGRQVKRLSLSGSVNPDRVDSATRKCLHVPSLEQIRFRVNNLEEEFHNCLMHYFDLPSLKQCEIAAELLEGLIPWRHLLLREFPPLELFKFELGSSFSEHLEVIGIPEESAYQPLPLAGLQFQHVHLSVTPTTLTETRKCINWWSSTFRALSDSNATIHFTELTFAFRDVPGIETLEGAWTSLDDSLADTTLSGVRSIHFERIDWYTREKITQAACPALADKIRLALPRLASRGVLCFT